MRKRSKDTFPVVCLIAALAGLTTGFALSANSGSQPVLHQATIPLAPNPGWSVTGNLNTARSSHTATLLANGKVLVVGGYTASSDVTDSAELYDPATGTWRLTGNLNVARIAHHTATWLPNGKILVAGGTATSSAQTAELYDPAAGTWSLTGNLKAITSGFTATLLANGKVLIAGGYGLNSASNTAELYDPATETWSLTGGLKTARYWHTATLLENGQVLVTGGSDDGDLASTLASAELYDPVTGQWSATANLNRTRIFHTATLLADGKVLVTGGYNWPPESLTSVELYDPATAKWSIVGDLSAARENHTATLLPGGAVLVVGGDDWNRGYPPNATELTELYDSGIGKLGTIGNLSPARSNHTATLLPNGKLLIAGGFDHSLLNSGLLNNAQLFEFGSTRSGMVASVSAANYSSMGLASESIAAGYGAGLAVTTLSANVLPLPTQLAGTTVKVKDSAGAERLAPLFFVSPTQVNYQIPSRTTAGAATVTITSPDGSVSTGVALMHTVAPSLFTFNQSGYGVAAAVALRIKADGTRSYEEVTQFDAAQNTFVARPIDLGPEGDQVFLILFGTGIRFRTSLSAVIATIGGVYAEVSFAGPQPDFAGLDQVNILLPRSLIGRGDVDALLTVDAQMANPAGINIK